MQFRLTAGRTVFGLLAWGVLAGPGAIEAQVANGRLPLQPKPPGGQDRVIPFLEGWYANEDGTYTISFGYLNQTRGDTVMIPLGEDNFLGLSQLDGMQPTTFYPGRQRGVFTVTLPAEMKDEDVWWNLRSGNGQLAIVPGRTSANAYELDWNSRPQGSRHPLVSFGSSTEEGRGPGGIMLEETLTTSVGSPITLSVNARDPSERDPADHRFAETIPLRVVWSLHQAPGGVVFTRHESNPLPERDEEEEPDSAAIAAAIARGGAAAAAAARAARRPPGPQIIPLSEGQGVASVIATFSEPGEYILRAQVDNFSAPDSTSGDQCCWTNGYVKVIVTQ